MPTPCYRFRIEPCGPIGETKVITCSRCAAEYAEGYCLPRQGHKPVDDPDSRLHGCRATVLNANDDNPLRNAAGDQFPPLPIKVEECAWKWDEIKRSEWRSRTARSLDGIVGRSALA